MHISYTRICTRIGDCFLNLFLFIKRVLVPTSDLFQVEMIIIILIFDVRVKEILSIPDFGFKSEKIEESER